jgi:hypothetical protein
VTNSLPSGETFDDPERDMTKRLIPIAALATLSLMACTPEDVQRWQEWHAADPAAAQAFADDYVARADGAAERSSVWDDVAACESGGNWSINTGTYDGGLQFHPDTWRGFNGTQFADYAWQATRDEQITVAERVLAEQGWEAWPTCSRRLGLR